ncbi:Arabinanase/levansucrase/invertase [Fomitopsis betulina]|nr:Arabinanase/levansucrase/invertase [Fomitopsis betulina]
MFSFSGALLIAGALGASAAPVVDVASAPALFKRNVTTGPVIDHDFPDPSIILLNQTWYAYSTSAGGKNVPVASSTDFNTTWTIVADALPDSGDWIDPDDSGIWAPDVRQLGNDSYIMYYTGKPTANDHHCVAAALGSSPLGPFTAPSAPFICDEDGGGIIDISGFQDIDGTRYVVYKVDGSAIDSDSTPIRLQRVLDDGFTLDGLATTLIDRDDTDGPLVEAPSLVYWDGWYYLFHSSHMYDVTQYDVRYAVSKKVTGPYTKATVPFLQTGDHAGLTAPGGATVINVDDKYVNMVLHGDLNGQNITKGRAMWAAPRICLNNGTAGVSC